MVTPKFVFLHDVLPLLQISFVTFSFAPDLNVYSPPLRDILNSTRSYSSGHNTVNKESNLHNQKILTWWVNCSHIKCAGGRHQGRRRKEGGKGILSQRSHREIESDKKFYEAEWQAIFDTLWSNPKTLNTIHWSYVVERYIAAIGCSRLIYVQRKECNFCRNRQIEGQIEEQI